MHSVSSPSGVCFHLCNLKYKRYSKINISLLSSQPATNLSEKKVIVTDPGYIKWELALCVGWGGGEGFVSGFAILSLSQPYQTWLPYSGPYSSPGAPSHVLPCRSLAVGASPHPTPLPPGVSSHPCSAVLDGLRSRESHETKKNAH